MTDFEAIYLRLPVPLQHLACSARGWHVEHTRYSKSFHDLLAITERRMQWPREQVQRFRDERLAAFIAGAASTPFYRPIVDSSQVEEMTVEDLAAFPILSKRTVQERAVDFQSTSSALPRTVVIHTSGTTGAGLRFTTTRCAIQEQWATWWRYRRWHGIGLRTWCGYFGGRSVVPVEQSEPPFWRYNYPGRQLVFSAYHLSEKNLTSYLEELRRRRPPWLHGYPSLMTLLATHVIETGFDLGYQIRWVTTGAETLRPQQRVALEHAFGVRPRQHYGLTEAVANFSECERGMLHVDEDFSAVEFVPTRNGDAYRIIGTNFTNPSTPLIRYDTQDLATLSEGPCGCGRWGRVVETIDGRVEDYIVLKNGAQLGRMDHIFKDMTHVREAQIVQHMIGAIEIRVVRSAAYDATDEAALLGEVRKRVGDDTKVDVSYVSELERSRTGKLRFVISELPRITD